MRNPVGPKIVPASRRVLPCPRSHDEPPEPAKVHVVVVESPPEQQVWQPLDLLAPKSDPLADDRANRWAWTFVLLGIAIRTIRYALRFPLWEDECFLSANLLDRGYADLMGGLDYAQVCPLLFLWVQRAMVGLLGFHEYSLRLFPFLCGLGSLLVFRHLAGRLLRGSALVLAVAIFAVSYPMIRYSAEAKQYSSDLLVGLLMLALAVEWWRRPERRGWLWALAAVMPLAVGISFPAVFVGGGLGLFVALVLWKTRDRRGWVPWAVYGLVLAASFAGSFALSAGSQSATTLEFMQDCWRAGFPPLSKPLELVRWLIVTHSSDLVAYPFGGHNGGSTLTLVACAAGVVVLVRRRQWPLAVLCLAPLALNFAAAAIHRYPYGQMVKFQFHLALAFCILAAIGAATLLSRPRKGRPVRTAPLTIALALLVAFGAGSAVRDVLSPAKSSTVERARDFARWFWFTTQFDGEVACLKTDLKRSFSPRSFERGLSAMYLCNQRIYSPRHARGEPPRWDRVAAERPLRCVEYRDASQPYDRQRRDAWLQAMKARYDLVAVDRYPFVLGDRTDAPPRELDYLDVYKFVPKPTRTAQRGSGQGPSG